MDYREDSHFKDAIFSHANLINRFSPSTRHMTLLTYPDLNHITAWYACVVATYDWQDRTYAKVIACARDVHGGLEAVEFLLSQLERNSARILIGRDFREPFELGTQLGDVRVGNSRSSSNSSDTGGNDGFGSMAIMGNGVMAPMESESSSRSTRDNDRRYSEPADNRRHMRPTTSDLGRRSRAAAFVPVLRNLGGDNAHFDYESLRFSNGGTPRRRHSAADENTGRAFGGHNSHGRSSYGRNISPRNNNTNTVHVHVPSMAGAAQPGRPSQTQPPTICVERPSEPRPNRSRSADRRSNSTIDMSSTTATSGTQSSRSFHTASPTIRIERLREEGLSAPRQADGRGNRYVDLGDVFGASTVQPARQIQTQPPAIRIDQPSGPTAGGQDNVCTCVPVRHDDGGHVPRVHDHRDSSFLPEYPPRAVSPRFSIDQHAGGIDHHRHANQPPHAPSMHPIPGGQFEYNNRMYPAIPYGPGRLREQGAYLQQGQGNRGAALPLNEQPWQGSYRYSHPYEATTVTSGSSRSDMTEP